MEWLTRLPVIGPWIARLMRTHAWRTYEHLEDVHWTRLAAAITFVSFVALFPLLTVGAAVGAALLSPGQLKELEGKLAEQVPGIADQLNIGGLVDNAGTVGAIAAVLLVLTGVSWVGALRDCLRAVWHKDDEPENPFLQKPKDFGVLVGLGVVALLSVACSALAGTAVGRLGDAIGLDEHGPGRALLSVAGFCIAVLVDLLILVYLLTLLPGVTPNRRDVVVASLIGAIGFELLKLLISGYLQSVATKSMYGAFGVPIALLLWINFTAKLLLYCAAWTATPHSAELAAAAAQKGRQDPPGEPERGRPERPGTA
ncbi:YihY/virulence factor BrkB family protein [Actinacidiphila glaucinigra]|uniref:YihY/virulence factor BrkB family protein n=1 Tax=Actinacidiphila glaucinigra TaxID=235986 RepID=UPI002DDB0B29|nr:YihY/virulence factor BrkB family protein [Actinacidiphila glaucinigra]WSD60519.1 YihY/virulence factor BrkB family protein [Actinacidiphila glaucinigra]